MSKEIWTISTNYQSEHLYILGEVHRKDGKVWILLDTIFCFDCDFLEGLIKLIRKLEN